MHKLIICFTNGVINCSESTSASIVFQVAMDYIINEKEKELFSLLLVINGVKHEYNSFAKSKLFTDYIDSYNDNQLNILENNTQE